MNEDPVSKVNIDWVSDTEESSEIFEVNLEEISSDEDQWTDSESDDDDDEWTLFYSEPQCSCQTLFTNECIFFSVFIF